MRSRCFRHAGAVFSQLRGHGWRTCSHHTAMATKIDKRCFSNGSINSETLEVSKKRLIMRVTNTGMKELDIVLTSFMSTRIELWKLQDVEAFHAILDIDTPVLFRTFILMKSLPDELRLNSVAAELLRYTQTGNLESDA